MPTLEHLSAVVKDSPEIVLRAYIGRGNVETALDCIASGSCHIIDVPVPFIDHIRPYIRPFLLHEDHWVLVLMPVSMLFRDDTDSQINMPCLIVWTESLQAMSDVICLEHRDGIIGQKLHMSHCSMHLRGMIFNG